jgi:hypothetical protein
MPMLPGFFMFTISKLVGTMIDSLCKIFICSGEDKEQVAMLMIAGESVVATL